MCGGRLEGGRGFGKWDGLREVGGAWGSGSVHILKGVMLFKQNNLYNNRFTVWIKTMNVKMHEKCL